MSAHPYDLKDAITELKTALKPLGLLAESMRGLDKSHRLQADLNLIEQCYSEQERKRVYTLLDAAFTADLDATDTVMLSAKRSSDQRTFEQYAQAHGEEQAQKAFTSREDAAVLFEAAQKSISELKTAHPVLYRVHSQVRNG